MEQVSPLLDPIVRPFDEHNRTLLENVHPPGWENPTPKRRYHLVVVGGGTGGLVSAAIGAVLGARVALVERRLLGGDCLNAGCVPSKALIRAARSWAEARRSAREFGGPEVAADGDFSRAMERMRRLRAQISPHDAARRFRDLGVDVFLGEGRFAGSDTLEVDGARLRFRRAIIATGARPAAPPIPGLAACSYLTNETLFSLTERPERFVVLGGGPIGCEMAQAFARLGSQVTLLDLAPQVLPREDPDAAAIVARALDRDGVRLELGVEATAVECEGREYIVRFKRKDGSREGTAAGDALLVAVGRAPNVEGLGLEAAGVRYGRHGVEVDDRLRTSNPRIFAVGDVASRYKFTHAADAQARIAVANALFFARKRASHLVIPWCTYTSPELAHVGLGEKAAREAGYDVETLTVPLAEVDRAVLDSAAEGFVRLHFVRRNGRLLGGTIVAEHAGELAGELALAVTARLKVRDLGRTIHPYPTQAEIFRKAADLYARGRFTPGLRRVVGVFLKIFS